MHIINTIDDRKFSFNGMPYLRNYISAVHSQGIEIFNCYERHDVLAARTPHSEYRVNGIAYSTPAALQTALLDVIYSRNTMGGAIPDQDNIDIRKYFHYISSYTPAQILQEINGLQPYTLSEKQSAWFIGRTFGLVPVNPGGVLSSGGLSSSTRNPLAPASLIKYKMMNKGKGVYGMGGIQLAMDDLELIYQNTPTESDIAQDPETDIVNFGDLGAQEIHDWLNLHTSSIQIQPQNEGYTLFKGTVESETKSFLWVGEAGTYGLNETQSAAVDFQLLEDVAPTPYIPGQNEVTAMGNTIIGSEHRFVKVVDGAQVQAHAIGEDGAYFEKNDFTIVEKYADPIANVEYTKPAKAQNDTYAMLSDVERLIKYDIPFDFFMSTNPAAPIVTYISDEPKELDFSNILPEIAKDMFNEVVRDKQRPNNIFLTGNFYTEPGFILVLEDCYIQDNLFRYSRISGAELPFGRIHGLVYHDGYLYATNRPDSTGIGRKILKINPYNLDDVKVLDLIFQLPSTGDSTDIKVYGDKLYCLFGGSTSGVYFIEIDSDLENYRTVFVAGTISAERVRPQSDFIIYKDLIYIPTYNNNGGSLGLNTMGLQVFNFSGELVNSVSGVSISTDGLNTPYVHWATVVNDKLIFSLSRGSGHRKLIRFNLDLTLDSPNAILELPHLITDDNTVFSNGDIYLNEERLESEIETVTCRLIKVPYNNFTALSVVIDNYHNGEGSHGSINPIVRVSEVKIRTSKLINDGNGNSPFATEQYVEDTITNTIGVTEYPETAYSQSILWGGTTAPSGTLTANWRGQKIGKKVSVRINISHTIAGSALSTAQIPLPDGLPLPSQITGFNGTNNFITVGTGIASTDASSSGVFSKVVLRKVSGTSYTLFHSFASGSYSTLIMNLEYFID